MVKKTAQSSGTLRRGVRLGKLGLSLTGSYLGYQAQNLFLGENPERRRQFQQRSSRRVREELGSLKGAAMKLGQILSLQTRVLPQEAIEELSGLQMQAPPMHPTLTRAQFKAGLGKYPEDAFREFDAEPFAAASLGQVHRAITRDGERVAVKIQYPAIREAIENDFKLLRSAAFPGRLTGHLPAVILDEVQRGFLEETDYLHEGRNIEFFVEGLRPLEYVTLPRVRWDLTAERVLTMSFVEGEALGAFLKRKAAAAVRNLIGERLVELFHFQLHQLKALHADQHPGNYLFKTDGSIGLVDFGCVKRISFDATALIHGCLERRWRKGQREAQHVLELVFGPKVPYARARKMLPTLELMADILFPEGKGANHAVDFGKGDALDMLARALQEAVRAKATNPEFAFVSRSELGIYSLLHRLNATVDVTAVWKRVCDRQVNHHREEL